jgi:hypothetical protein
MIKTVRSLQRQRGLTMLGWAFVILLFAFAITCAYRVAPPYYDNWQIRNSLETLSELKLTESAFDGASDSDIRSHLGRFFTVNNIPSALLKNLQITRTKGRVYVDLDWEVRSPFLYNIDVVVSFENQFDSLSPSECCTPKADTTKTRE